MIQLSVAQQAALDLERNILVRAGAGSGKTTLLVARYLALFEQDDPPDPAEVLMLTFTEKAASEMAARIRESMERARPEVSTIHAFAARALQQDPLHAGFELQDPGQQQQRLSALLDGTLLELEWRQPALLEPLAECFSRAALLRMLNALFGRRTLAREWSASVLTHADVDTFEQARIDQLSQATRLLAAEIRVNPAWDRLARVARIGCDEPLAAHLERLSTALSSSVLLTSGAPEALRRHLDELRSLIDRSKGVWRRSPEISAALSPAVNEFRELVSRRRPARDLAQTERLAARMEYGLAQLWQRCLEAYQTLQREQLGLLDFDDLVPLVEPGRFRERYRYILVDEFQDTDREQWAMIRGLAADPGEPIPPGKLFLVGDEKQSIYRFRGAEVSVFNAALSEFDVVELSENYRSRAALLTVLNETFDRVLAPEGTDWAPHEARPQPLTPGLPAQAEGGTVQLLITSLEQATQTEDLSAARTLDGPDAREAASVAALLLRLAQAGRPYEQMAVLLRTRQLLPALRDAFESAGIPYLVWRGGGFYQSPEVRDLVGLLACLDDAEDRVALLGLLRSPFVGLSDVGLFQLGQLGGLDQAAGLTSLGEGPLGRRDACALENARQLLRRHRRGAQVLPVAAVLTRMLHESGAWTAYAEQPDGPQALANIDKLLGICRTLDRGHGIPEVLEVLRGLIATGYPEGMAPTPQAGQAGVRLMTVHAAKGLQFPVVVVPGLTRAARAGGDPLLLEQLPELGARVAFGLPTDEPPLMRQLIGARLDALERAESKRLLYVACTRAQEQLILSAALRETEQGYVSPNAGGRVWQWWSLLADAWGFPDGLPVDAAPPGITLVRGGLEAARPPLPDPRETPPPPLTPVRLTPRIAATPVIRADLIERHAQCPLRYYYAAVLEQPHDGIPAPIGLPFEVAYAGQIVTGHLEPPTQARLDEILGSPLLAQVIESARSGQYPAPEDPPCDQCGFRDSGICTVRR